MGSEMKENWKPVVGYENRYIVSSHGVIKSLPHIRNISGFPRKFKGKKLKPTITMWGYMQVKLQENKVKRYARIHQLVAESFLLKPPGKIEVNHINGIKTDNRVENLEWVTRSENILHCQKLLGHSNNRRKVMQKSTGIIFNSTKEASLSIGKQKDFVSEQARRRKRTDWIFIQ